MMKNTKTNYLRLIQTAILYLIFISNLVHSAEMIGLGVLSGENFHSKADAISGDGSTVTGYSYNTENNKEAYTWTSAGGMVGLGTLGGSTSDGHGINDDGSVIVGDSYDDNGNQLAYIHTSSGMMSLGDFAGGYTNSSANAVSRNGLVVVGDGSSVESDVYAESMRWTASDGMQSLGTLTGGSHIGEATGVNIDGSVIVGYARNSSNFNEAYRWTSATGMVGLGSMSQGSYSRAHAVSSDGNIIVGHGENSGNTEAFRWTQAGGMVSLGILSGWSESSATAVSNDGRVVVGNGTDDEGDYKGAFRWTEATGMQSIAQWLADSGYTLTGWSNLEVYGVSDDGDVIVGYGTSANGTEAFIARGQSGKSNAFLSHIYLMLL